MPTADFAARVDSTMDRIDESDEIHPHNKELLAEFKRDLKLQDLSDGWLQKLTSHLKIVAEHVGDTPFEELDEDDIKDLVEWAQDRTKENGDPLSEATVNAYKQVIKRFWRWLYDTPKGEHPEMVDWINTTPQNGNGTLPTDLLTRDDVDALKDGTRNDRDRAFVALLYETGARIGELIDLTVGDIEDHPRKGKKVVIDGKTGQRRLWLVEAVPPLNDWLAKHPSGDRADPLWCRLQDAERQVSYHYIRQKLLEGAKERAGLEKPVNPHHFRHSRASELANEFTEAQLCEWFGWVQGSDIPAKYVHLSGRDIDDAYGQLHGIVDEDGEDDEETVVECWRCEDLNEPHRRFCGGCGAALDATAAVELDEAEEKTTADADEEDLQLALRLVEHVGENRDAIEAFLDGDE